MVGLALAIGVPGLLLLAFGFHKAEIIGDEPQHHEDTARVLEAGFVLILTGAFLGLLAALS